ncbi:hypothetical protein ACFV23_22745 [Streptomyces sp. NPDC059627]
MGVFARFLGKKPKAAEEPDAKVPAVAEPDASGPENATEDAAEPVAEEAAEAAAQGPDEDAGRSAGSRTEAETDIEHAPVAAESTEIPKQQSAKEAADNEAGENART